MIKLKTAFITFLLTILAVCSAQAQMMSVEIKKVQVRSEPSFLMGKVIAELSYGDRVNVREKKGPWHRVALSGTSRGWIHNSALTKKRVVLRPGASDVRKAVANDELALAGKGFSRQVEGEFKSRNPNIDFKWIDKMESFVVPQSEIQKFLKQGELYPGGGSQ